MGVCLGLHDAKNATVRTAADMTVRQIISLLFGRVADELGVTGASAAAAGPAAAQAGTPGAGGAGAAAAFARDGVSGSTHVDDNEAGAEEEAVIGEEDEEEGGAGEGALRCAHLVFQVRASMGGGGGRGRGSVS